MNFSYNIEYYNTESPKIIVPFLLDLLKPISVLDIGCGIGTWLKVFQDKGVTEVFGIDGDHINDRDFLIERVFFQEKDVSKPFDLNKIYDIVISLEVAEHIVEEKSDHYISNLVKHGDIILFSAAIPGQGGFNHVNEQWPSYWQNKFNKHGYVFYDIIRPKIWDNNNINFWYKQNIFIVAKKGHPKLKDYKSINNISNVVHPDIFQYYAKHANRGFDMENGKLGWKISLKILLNTIRHKLLN